MSIKKRNDNNVRCGKTKLKLEKDVSIKELNFYLNRKVTLSINSLFLTLSYN